MLLVLDTNIYLYAFATSEKPACKAIVNLLADFSDEFRLSIPRTIAEEVRRNLPHDVCREFFGFLADITSIDEDFFVPFELGVKYERMGLKEADAFIAAYAEWVGADVLVSENRHFLTKRSNLPFKILNAENCLKIIAASMQ